MKSVDKEESVSILYRRDKLKAIFSPATVPIVQTAEPSFQPSALVFRSGIAFDYDNFPRILSVCWPVFNIESGMSLIARDGPERNLTEVSANETINISNDAPLSGAPVFTWGPPHTKPEVKDLVNSAPEKKAPTGIPIRDPCELHSETITSNTDECVKSTSERQEEATTIPHVSQKQGSCYEAVESTTSKEVEISGEKNSQEGSFDKVQLSANKQRSDSEEVTICKDLGQKRAKIEPVQVTSCALQARCSLDPANHESEKFGHPYRSIKPHKRPNVSDCERDTMSTSKESKMFSSSTEAKPVSFSRLF